MSVRVIFAPLTGRKSDKSVLATAAGTAKRFNAHIDIVSVRADWNQIVTSANALLDSESEYNKMALAHNPFGDGHAAERIVERMQR